MLLKLYYSAVLQSPKKGSQGKEPPSCNYLGLEEK